MFVSYSKTVFLHHLEWEENEIFFKHFFHLTVQYLEKHSRTVQQLAYGGWPWVSRQEELWLEEGREVGDGRAEGSSATGDGRQAAIAPTHVWRWWYRFWFLATFNSIYPLAKMIQWCLGRSSFPPLHRWHGSTGLPFEWLSKPSCTTLCLGPLS